MNNIFPLSIKNINDAELNYYIFSVSNLGWINCDRFTEEKELTDFIVNAPGNAVQVKMIFSDINSVLKAKGENDRYSFTGVPKNRTVTIFALKRENNTLLSSFTKTKITNNERVNLVFKETNLSDLKRELEKLN
jgi:hypothetical protein